MDPHITSLKGQIMHVNQNIHSVSSVSTQKPHQDIIEEFAEETMDVTFERHQRFFILIKYFITRYI